VLIQWLVEVVLTQVLVQVALM
jgi:hypothetical protein